MKILIIDDNEDDRLLYRRCLQKDAYEIYDIVESDDGEKGLQQIQVAPPDCVLLDYSLPGYNGIEILKRIRAAQPFVSVVMLTGQGNESIAVTAMHEGAQNYITKSAVTPEAIQRIVRSAVEHCAMEKRIHEQRTALEIFTRALAHDLKEPVRTIKSFLDLLIEGEIFSESGKEYTQYIQKAAERMGNLVETVYFYTRLDTSPEQIAREHCDIAAVLEEVKDNIAQLIRDSGAAITHGSLPRVYINHMHLIQILQNLICNAIRHSDKKPEIHIDAARQDDKWILRIADNGIGIADHYGAQVFEPFRRMNHQKEQGLGLGLAICKKIVESYGGKIWYESTPGKGTMFFFTLPQDTTDTSSLTATPTIQPEAALQGKPESIARIMLVDDNEADIKLAKILLIDRVNLQCHLTIARDGTEALEILQSEINTQGKPDLLLLDINMPRMSGFELLERMRDQDELRGIPVVMCTTSNDDKDIARAKSLGAVGYMNKPAGLDKLKPFIEQIPCLNLQTANGGYALLRTG